MIMITNTLAILFLLTDLICARSPIKLIYPTTNSVLYVKENLNPQEAAPFYFEITDDKQISKIKRLGARFVNKNIVFCQNLYSEYDVEYTLRSGNLFMLVVNAISVPSGLYSISIVDDCDFVGNGVIYATVKKVYLRSQRERMDSLPLSYSEDDTPRNVPIQVSVFDDLWIKFLSPYNFVAGKILEFKLYNALDNKFIARLYKTYYGDYNGVGERNENIFTIPISYLENLSGWFYLDAQFGTGVDSRNGDNLWVSAPFFIPPKSAKEKRSFGALTSLNKQVLKDEFSLLNKDITMSLLKDGWYEMLWKFIELTGSYHFRDGELIALAIRLGDDKFLNQVIRKGFLSKVVYNNNYNTLIEAVAEVPDDGKYLKIMQKSENFPGWFYLQKRLENCLKVTVKRSEFSYCDNCLAVVLLNGLLKEDRICRSNLKNIFVAIKNDELKLTKEQIEVALPSLKYFKTILPEEGEEWSALITAKR